MTGALIKSDPFCANLQKFVIFKIKFFLFIVFLLLGGLFLIKLDHYSLLEIPFKDFFPLLTLVLPFFMLIPTIFNFTSKPSIINKSELNNYAYEMIIPSVNSWLKQKRFVLRIGIFFWMLLIIFPMLSILAPTKLNSVESNNLYYIALFLYGAGLWRYLMIYQNIEKHSITINNHGIAFPVFGFFKTCVFYIAYKDIEDSVMYGSHENVEITLNENIDQAIEDLTSSNSTFMQGICIWDKRGKSYIFSNKLIPTEILSKMYKQLPGDKGQLISEFN